MDCYDNCVLYNLRCKICGQMFFTHDKLETICDECKEKINPQTKCIVCGEYIEVEDSSCVWIKVCDECKKAIKWAKTQMQERNAK